MVVDRYFKRRTAKVYSTQSEKSIQATGVARFPMAAFP